MTYRGINFNGDHGSGQGFQYWCNFSGSNYWAADRLLVLCSVTSPEPDLSLYVHNNTVGYIDYALDAWNFCIIDITEIARTYNPYSYAIVLGYGQHGDQAAEITVLNKAPKGLINPARVIIPEHALQGNGVQILPPDVMFRSLGSKAFDTIVFEFRASANWDIIEYEGADDEIFVIEQPSHELFEDAVDSFLITKDAHAASSTNHAFELREQECGHVYAMVEWESFTGATRRHVFEVVNQKQEKDEKFELINLENGYNAIVGRKDGMTLKMKDLSAYDYWYYADLITANNAKISLDGTNYDDITIATKSARIPDGERTDNVLEIEINWRHYDAVDM